MNLDQLTITLGDGTKIELESGFVGGIMKDVTRAPMGLYSGKMSTETACVTLIQLLRAAIKLCHEELKMEPIKYDSFLHFCVDQAVTKELENNKNDNHSLQDHEIYLKMKQEREK